MANNAWGTITHLADNYKISRPFVYSLAAALKEAGEFFSRKQLNLLSPFLYVVLRDLRCYSSISPCEGQFGKGLVREDLPALVLVLVLWILKGDGSKDLLYPFGLAHLMFYQRCQQALQRAECWVRDHAHFPSDALLCIL